MPNYDAPLTAVLDKVGGPTKLAIALGIGASAVTQWTRVPSHHLPRVTMLTGMSGKELRPDLYRAPGAADEGCANA